MLTNDDTDMLQAAGFVATIALFSLLLAFVLAAAGVVAGLAAGFWSLLWIALIVGGLGVVLGASSGFVTHQIERERFHSKPTH